MTKRSEFDQGWLVSVELTDLEAKKRRQASQGDPVEGRFVQARGKRLEARITELRNALTPPATSRANTWRRPAIDAAWAAFRANEQIPFKELLDHVMTVPGVPDEEAVRRFLNQMGFTGKPGRPKK